MAETSWSMSFSGTAEDNEQSREEFKQLFVRAMDMARAMSNETMNCNGQFYSRGDKDTISLTEETYDAEMKAAKSTTTTTGKVNK